MNDQDQAMRETTGALAAQDISEILRHIPHRYPFLLIDRMEACEPNRWVRVTKNITAGEWFFNDDRGHRVMPQLLVVEALAQAAGVLCHHSGLMSESGASLVLLAGIDDFEVLGDAGPGDVLTLECTLLRTLRGVAKLEGRACVDERPIARATLIASMPGGA